MKADADIEPKTKRRSAKAPKVSKQRAPAASARRGLSPETLERFVYLVGPPRSGTTVMTRTFYLSERVFGLPNPTRFTHRIWRYRNKVDPRMLTDIFKMPEFYRERRPLRTLDSAERDSLERVMRKAFATKDLGQMYKLYPMLHALDPKCTLRPERALCWADKGNDVYGLFDVAESLPQAKFILFVRDPRATIASMKGQTVRSRGEEGSRRANVTALIASCFYWRNMMQNFLRLAQRYPGRTYFLRYEDFVSDSTKAMNGALEFAAGEEMPAAAIQAGLAQFPHKRKHIRKHGQKVDTFGIDYQPLERWRTMLDSDEINLVNALTWRTAHKLGYPIDKPQRHLSALRALSQVKAWKDRGTLAAKLGFLGIAEPFTPRISGARSDQSGDMK